MEGLEDLVSSPGYQLLQVELREHLEACIKGSRGAKTWEDHMVWEARATLIEEMIPLAQVLLEQDREAKEAEKLEKKEEV